VADISRYLTAGRWHASIEFSKFPGKEFASNYRKANVGRRFPRIPAGAPPHSLSIIRIFSVNDYGLLDDQTPFCHGIYMKDAPMCSKPRKLWKKPFQSCAGFGFGLSRMRAALCIDIKAKQYHAY